jgi:hypothetical protein
MEGEGKGSWLGGQWKEKEKEKVFSLAVNGRSHAWWPLECSMLGGQWNVKEKHPFTSSIFPQQTLLTPSIFSP